MPQTLELPDALAEVLSEEANRLGIPLNDHAATLLNTGRLPDHPAMSGTELVAWWHSEGLLTEETVDDETRLPTIR